MLKHDASLLWAPANWGLRIRGMIWNLLYNNG